MTESRYSIPAINLFEMKHLEALLAFKFAYQRKGSPEGDSTRLLRQKYTLCRASTQRKGSPHSALNKIGG